MALESRRYRTRTVQRLASDLQGQLRETGREAAQRVVKRIQADAPERNGFLKRSIGFRTISLPDGNFEVIFYADTKKAGAVRDYAQYVERGTRTPIRPVRAKQLALHKDLASKGLHRGPILYRRAVRGQRPQPFFFENVERFDDIYQGLRRRRGLTGR